jgi:hypothetical protein
MPDVSLCPIYPPGGALCGEEPTGYRVTAQGGALRAECRTLEAARLFFARWAEPCNVVCAWCGVGLRHEPALAEGLVSHGVCASCARFLDSGTPGVTHV